MKTTVHDAFVAMYYALEAATDEFPDQGLRTLVRDCDPFIWKDRLSADPAVYEDFSEAFAGASGDKPMGADQSRSFCREWLARQAKRHEFYAGPLVEAFDSVATPEAWADVLAGL